MRKIPGIILFLLLLQPMPVLCQANLDSLWSKLKVVNGDTLEVQLLLAIADAYETNRQDSTIYYLNKAKELSESLNYNQGLYSYYQESVIVSFTVGKYDLAMDQSLEALEIARLLGDTNKIIATLGNISIVNQSMGKYDTQLEYLLLALDIAEKSGKKKFLSGLYHNVGNVYYSLKQYKKSIAYCRLALKMHESTGENQYVNRISATLGQDYDALNMYDSALYFYKKAISESIITNDQYAEGTIYGYMTNLYLSQYDFSSMMEVSEKSLALSRELQSGQMLASSLYNVANAYYYTENLPEANKHISEALEIAIEDSLSDELKNIYTVLSYISAKKGDYRNSLIYQSKVDSIKTLVLNNEVLAKTVEAEEKYESEKKENQIRLQQHQLHEKEMLNYFLMAGTALILLLSVLLYRIYRHKQKLQLQRIEKLETEKKLAATTAVLQGEEQERSRLAKDLHDGLGGMLSGIKYSFSNMRKNLIMTPENQQAFERSIDMLDSCTKEMRRVAHNMMPESLIKYGLSTAVQDFCNDINESKSLQITYLPIGLENVLLDQTTAITVFRIVQELINNILKHAGAKTAIVQISNQDGHFTVTVEDDGKGFDKTILKATEGMGWTNIRHRIELLKAALDVNSQLGHGTSVHIDFNI